MRTDENVPLATLTTLKVGGVAHLVAPIKDEKDLVDAIALARAQNLPCYALGEGSNVLPNDEGYAGLIIRIEIPGISFEESSSEVVLTAGAGVSWDAVVRSAAERGVWGIENLAGIPGTMGAAPVQNIGAYGADLAQTLRFVDVYDANTGEVLQLVAADCELG